MASRSLSSSSSRSSILRARQFEAELPSSSASKCLEVVVALSTAITIPDYHRFYSTPIESFQPAYRSFPDGSLVARPLLEDISTSYILLLFIGALIMLFLRNVIVSADYIRRGRVRYKALFYVLLVSQIMGFLTFVLSATTYFIDGVNCKVVVVTAGVLTEISSALLLSGILGVKAYKCLNDSKWVLAIIGVLQVTSSSLILADYFQLQALRTLVGSCCIVSQLRFLLLGIITRLLIALFICMCFIYALWKSSKIPAAQGRISIGLSESTIEPLIVQSSAPSNVRRPRGWWDYVAETNSRSQQQNERTRATSWVVTEDQGFFKNMAILLRSFWSDPSTPQRKQAVDSPHSSAFEKSSSSKRWSEKLTHSERPNSVSHSVSRRMSRFTTRVHHFREAMRNELAHTAFITVTNVIAAVLGLIGVLGFSLPASPQFFTGANWAVLSLLVIHSFGRVVARNEREAQIQHPSAWDPTFKVQEATSSGFNDSHLQRAWSSLSIASNPRMRRGFHVPELAAHSPQSPVQVLPPVTGPSDNPFEDFESIREHDVGRDYIAGSQSSAATPSDLHHESSMSANVIPRDQSGRGNPFFSPTRVATHNIERGTWVAERDSVVSEYSDFEYDKTLQEPRLGHQ